VGLSDDLGKLDTYVEQITRKVANYLGEVLEDQRDKLHENLMAMPALIWQRTSDQAARQHVAQPEKVGKTNVVEDWKTQTHSDGGQGKMPKNLVEKFLTILLRRKEC